MGVADRAATSWIEFKMHNGIVAIKSCMPRKRGKNAWHEKPSLSFDSAGKWRVSRCPSHGFPYMITIMQLVALILFLMILWFTANFFCPPETKAHIEYGFTDDSVGHFIGSEECGIRQSNTYFIPISGPEGSSGVCKTRTDLLEALSGGGRHGYDEPFSGRGCTYKWFTIPEICMILERFNAITFIGDGLVQDIYTAFSMLLREDFSLGGLRQSEMSPEEQRACRCENQFHSQQCKQKFSIKSHLEAVKDSKSPKGGNVPFCSRIPHAYIPIYSSPTTVDAFSSFKSLIYFKPNPWQPSPMIHSLTLNTGPDTNISSHSLQEWLSYAAAAERNIPILSLGPMRATTGEESTKDNREIWNLSEEMKSVAEENHVDFLGLYNLTMQARGKDGLGFGIRIPVVEAMMVLNWLAKLPTS